MRPAAATGGGELDDSAISRGRFTADGENHLDRASGMMLETRERTFRMMELLGSSSGLLSVLALSTDAAAAAVVAIAGDRLPEP